MRFLLLILLGIYSPLQAAYVFEDSDGQLSPEAVISHSESLFSQHDWLAKGFSRSHWWLKIPLHNTRPQAHTMSILFKYPLLEQVDAFAVNEKGLSISRSGYSVPLSERQQANENPLFSFTLAAHSHKTIYVRVINEYSTHLDYEILDETALHLALSDIQQNYTFIISSLGILIVYNLMLFAYTRSPAYGYYLLCMLASLLTTMATFNRTGNDAFLNTHVISLIFAGGSLLYISAFLFNAAVFKETATPQTTRLSKWMIALVLLHLPVMLYDATLAMKVYAFYGSGLLITGALIWLLWQAYKSQHQLAVFISIGWIIFLMSSGFYILSLAGLAGVSFQHAFSYGAIIEGLIFSLALGYRIRRIEKLDIEKQQAEKAVLIQSRFLANMSHEIRTPMNAIVGMSKILQSQPLNPESKQLINIINNSANTLINLLNDILDLSKIEEDKIQLELVDFDMQEILHSVFNLYQHKATANNIRFIKDFPATDPLWLQGDPNRIRQILLNLLSNAFKFTQQGHVRLHCDYDPQQQLLTLQVTDTGIGISTDKQDRIFQRFEQLDNSIARQYGGSGLGLNITYKLVKLMNGQIKVFSELDHGTQFSVQLPLSVGQAKSAQSDSDEQQNFYFEGHILIADDVDSNRIMLRLLLEKMHIRVEEASNGVEVLDKLAQQNFDLIFMDIQMPELDGLATTDRIRSSESALQHIPIIAMTANVMTGDRELCLQHQMDDFIAKPVDFNQLRKALERWLPQTALPVWNKENLMQRIDHDENLLQEYLQIFIKDLQTNMHKLKLAITEQNPQLIKKSAHKIKGQAFNVAAMQISHFAQLLENQDNSVNRVKQILARLETAVKLFTEEIQQYSNSSG